MPVRGPEATYPWTRCPRPGAPVVVVLGRCPDEPEPNFPACAPACASPPPYLVFLSCALIGARQGCVRRSILQLRDGLDMLTGAWGRWVSRPGMPRKPRLRRGGSQDRKH